MTESWSTPAPRHRTAAEFVTARIRMEILTGDLAAGTMLRQDALAERFGISSIPVREALRILAGEGLVEIVPHKGARVAVLSCDDVTDLFAVRALLETEALRLSLPHLSADDIVGAEAEITGDAQDADARMERNRRFHLALYARCGRSRLLGLIDAQLDAVAAYLRLECAIGLGDTDEDEHHALLDACRAGDVAKATNLLGNHLAKAGEQLVLALQAHRRSLAAAG